MKEVIFEIYSNKSFLKIKNTCFAIGKVLFSFVNMDQNKKEIEHIDCYLDMDRAGAFAKSITLGYIKKAADVERSLGKDYPAAVWTSGLGGTKESKAGRDDGKAISRMFDFAPGSNKPYIFTATQRPGSSNELGLIIPDKGAKAEITVRVPVNDEDTVKALAYALDSAITAFRAAAYTKEYDELMENGKKRGSNEAPKTNATGNKPAGNKPKNNAPAPARNITQFPDKEQRFYRARSRSGFQPSRNNDGFIMMCSLDSNEQVFIKFTDTAIRSIDPSKWERFFDAVNAHNLTFDFEGRIVPRKDGVKFMEYVAGL